MNKLISQLTQRHQQTLLAIIGFGLLLRLHAWYTGQAYLYYSIHDEVSAYHMAMRLLAGDPVAWYLGQPAFSNGQLPGPLWTMFFAVAYKTGGSSVHGASLIVTLLNTGVIYLVYRLARQLLNPDYALLAAFLYATSPWTIYYGTGLWNPMPLALLGALLFLALWQTTRHDKSPAIFWVCVLTAAIPQFHMVGLFYAPVILLVMLLAPARWHRHWFAAGIIVGVAFYLPYLIGDMQNNWANTQAMLTDDGRKSWGALKIVSVPVTLLSNYPSSWVGYGFDEFLTFADRTFGSRYLLLAINVIALLFAAAMLGRFVRHGWQTLHQHRFRLSAAYAHAPAVMFLMLLIVVPLLIFILTRHNYNSRYAIIIFPLLLLVPAWYMQTTVRERARRIASILLLCMSVVNVYLEAIYYLDLNRRIARAELLMPSFRQLQQVHAALQQHAGAGAIIEIDNSDFKTRYGKSYPNLLANALKDFIAITERYEHQHNAGSKTVIYRLEKDLTVSDPLDRVGYNDHGIVLIQK